MTYEEAIELIVSRTKELANNPQVREAMEGLYKNGTSMEEIESKVLMMAIATLYGIGNNDVQKEDSYKLYIKEERFLDALRLKKENFSNSLLAPVYGEEFCMELNSLNFMKDVVKEHGTHKEAISKAINAVLNITNKSDDIKFEEKLWNDTMNLPEYRDAVINNIKTEIKEQDFFRAYMYIKNQQSAFTELDFMKEVVKEHGTDGEVLQKAVQVVSNIKDQSPAFMAKLLNDTLKTEEYQKAFEKEQGKAQEQEKENTR